MDACSKSASLRILSLEFYGIVTPQNSSLKLYPTAIHGGTARSGLVSKCDGTPLPHDKLKNRHGRAAWMPLGGCKAAGLGVVGWRYSAAPRQAQKPAGTPVFEHSARDRSGIIAAYPAQLLERIARFLRVLPQKCALIWILQSGLDIRENMYYSGISIKCRSFLAKVLIILGKSIIF